MPRRLSDSEAPAAALGEVIRLVAGFGGFLGRKGFGRD